jgi:hypothetical protein
LVALAEAAVPLAVLVVEVIDMDEEVSVMELVVRAAVMVDDKAVVGLALALLQYEVCCCWTLNTPLSLGHWL